jgi:competence protein ComEA
MRTSFVPAVLFSLLTGLSGLASAVEVPATARPVASAQANVNAAVTPVNINSADAATLEAGLVGIGAVKAQAIVAHRDANGPFASVDELLEVKGIGASILEKNRTRLSLQ